MITSIRLVNFKNFADETLRLGPFTILVGANASGKSNIRDAFRFLSGIGRGYTLAEIFGGKREAGWKPIRGAMNEIVRFDASDLSPTDPGRLAMRRGPRSLASELYSGHASFSLEVGLRLNGKEFRYSIEVGHSREPSVDVQFGPFRVQKEELRVESKTVYTTDPDHPAGLRANTDQPILTQYVMPGRTQRLRTIHTPWPSVTPWPTCAFWNRRRNECGNPLFLVRPCWATVARIYPQRYRKSAPMSGGRKLWRVGCKNSPLWT